MLIVPCEEVQIYTRVSPAPAGVAVLTVAANLIGCNDGGRETSCKGRFHIEIESNFSQVGRCPCVLLSFASGQDGDRNGMLLCYRTLDLRLYGVEFRRRRAYSAVICFALCEVLLSAAADVHTACTVVIVSMLQARR